MVAATKPIQLRKKLSAYLGFDANDEIDECRRNNELPVIS
jgi:hypothetical protein